MSDSLISIFFQIEFVMRNTVGMYLNIGLQRSPMTIKYYLPNLPLKWQVFQKGQTFRNKSMYIVHRDGIFLPQLWLWSRSQTMVASNYRIIRLLEKLKNWIATNGKINVWNIRSNSKYRKHTRNYIKYFSTIYLFNRLTRWIPTVANKRNAWQHIQWLDPKKQKTFSFEIVMIMFANQTIL